MYSYANTVTVLKTLVFSSPVSDVLSDILSYVLAKGAQQHAEQATDSPQHRVSDHEIIVQEAVYKSCFKMLHALAYKNYMVRIVMHKTSITPNTFYFHNRFRRDYLTG